MNWDEIHKKAAGHYNRNVRVDTPDGPVNVRTPIAAAPSMDLRIWDEAEVLRAVTHLRAPTVIHSTPDYQIHGFIEGDVLNDMAPVGTQIPGHVTPDVIAFMVELAQVPEHVVPPIPRRWPTGTDTIGFGRRIEANTQEVYTRLWERNADLYTCLEVPSEPLAPITSRWDTLTARPLGLVHGDIHRKNLIIQDQATFLIGWELAMWGDPIYELAVHLHRTLHFDYERSALLAAWERSMPATHSAGWTDDLDTYLAHEQVKSALVDVVRCLHAYFDQTCERDSVVAGLALRLNAARRRWGFSTLLSIDHIERCLRQAGQPR